MRTLCVALLCGAFCASGWAATVSPLFARGYTVIPEPQKVTLGTSNFTFGPNWTVKMESGVAANDVAVETLREDLSKRFHLTLDGHFKAPGGVLKLRVAPGSVQIGHAQDTNRAAIEAQAYRIDLKPRAVTITANAPTGLFYGVETLIQLLRPNLGALWLPEGSIVDWPDLQLRNIYWDDNHHLERMDAFKHALRQAAFYKINGFVVKLNGHFQYKSAPAVVDPYALSPAQLQELTNYGLHYHVQLIPYLDGPAHVAFILKHPQYKDLRAFPDSNYEMCVTNPETYKLLEGMYQDLMDANRGVKYFYLSTDEAYFLGMAHNSQCNEVDLAKKLGSPGQVFAHFMNKAGGYLHDHRRTVVFWGETPLKPADVPALAPYFVSGETGGPEFDRAFHKRGIRQMIYTSTQGAEPMFPDYFILPESQRLHPGLPSDEYADANRAPRVDNLMQKIASDTARIDSQLIGEVDAGWGDEGLHPETFWMGYVASGAAGWHPGSPNPQEVMSTFYPLFYGPKTIGMDRLYRMMSHQAQAYSDNWDTVPSTHRKTLWGSYYAIFNPQHPAHDKAIPLPPVPSGDLEYNSKWSKENARRIDLAARALEENSVVLGLIDENITKSQFNHYNLEVYLSIAELCRQSFQMIGEIHNIDTNVATAAKVKDTDPKKALASVDRALDIATTIWKQRNTTLQNATETWYKSWYPRVAEANGRHFLRELDDVKDHLPDRTVDMTYLVYREKILPFGKWVNAIAAARNQFAKAHNLPVRSYHLDWQSFTVPAPVCSSAAALLANPSAIPADTDQAATCGM